MRKTIKYSYRTKSRFEQMRKHTILLIMRFNIRKILILYKLKFVIPIKFSSVLCLVVSDSFRPHGLQPTRLFGPSGFSRQEYWSGLPCSPPGDLPNLQIEPRSPALQADSFPSEPPGKPNNIGVGSLSLLQENFLTQELNQGLLH